MTENGHLNILGTRGIPAAHGGFETFAERLAVYLVAQGHGVTVYCQHDGVRPFVEEDHLNGIHRVHIGTRMTGALGTIAFDLAAVRHVLDRPGADLVLGYNTALFTHLQRWRGRRVFMNMDGVEWKRRKWGRFARAWLRLNEYHGARACDQPIADHPGIADHIKARSGRDCVMIPYGADRIAMADFAPVAGLGPGLLPGRYFLAVARIEPDNSILEIIRAYGQSGADMPLVVLGRIDPANAYHQSVKREAARAGAILAGPIYEPAVLRPLRFHARAYLHGHQVGGTNPSLVEALGAGNPVIAHDNAFNRWTAGAGQHYFADEAECAQHIATLARDDVARQASARAAIARHEAAFRWDNILGAYRELMLAPQGLQVAAE